MASTLCLSFPRGSVKRWMRVSGGPSGSSSRPGEALEDPQTKPTARSTVPWGHSQQLCWGLLWAPPVAEVQGSCR